MSLLSLTRRIGLTREVIVIRKRVGDYLTAIVRVDTGGMELHTAGCDLLYPPVLVPDGEIGEGPFSRVTVNHFAAERRMYIAGEMDSAPITGDLLLAGVPFRCDSAGEGLVIAISGEKAIRRNTTAGTYQTLPTGVQFAEFSVDGVPVEPPPAGVVLFKVVVE